MTPDKYDTFKEIERQNRCWGTDTMIIYNTPPLPPKFHIDNLVARRAKRTNKKMKQRGF